VWDVVHGFDPGAGFYSTVMTREYDFVIYDTRFSPDAGLYSIATRPTLSSRSSAATVSVPMWLSTVL
jgi:hypothetical protein